MRAVYIFRVPDVLIVADMIPDLFSYPAMTPNIWRNGSV